MNPLPPDARLLAALRAAQLHLSTSELAAAAAILPGELPGRLEAVRQAGFDVELRPGFGYRLIASPDRLVGDDIRARLGLSTLVREIVVFQETASTNDAACRIGQNGAPGGLVVLAESQTAGRGRFGRRWDSPPHCGVWMSLLLRPEMPFARWPRVTTWAAAAIARAVEPLVPGHMLQVKWPNDVLLDGRKAAGILMETGTDLRGDAFAVLGIGINANQAAGDFPPELADRACSLGMVRGVPVDRAALATSILRELELSLPTLLHEFPTLVAEVAALSSVLGRWIEVQVGNETVSGLAVSLDEEGHLLLQTSDGEVRMLTGGEVTLGYGVRNNSSAGI